MAYCGQVAKFNLEFACCPGRYEENGSDKPFQIGSPGRTSNRRSGGGHNLQLLKIPPLLRRGGLLNP